MNKSLRYQEQDSEQTLAEGLEEYYANMPNLFSVEEMRPEAKELFVPHDVAHVIFGCDTSLHQETLIDMWTILGSDVGFATYLAYLRVPEARQAFKGISPVTLAKEVIGALPDVGRVISRTRKMRSKWTWKGFEAYKNRSLKEIREELGIRIIGSANQRHSATA